MQKSTCTTRTTLGRYAVQIWTRGGHVPLRIEGNETLVLHRVVRQHSISINAGQSTGTVLEGICGNRTWMRPTVVRMLALSELELRSAMGRRHSSASYLEEPSLDIRV